MAVVSNEMNNYTPLISIITVVYNGVSTLRNTIISVINQSYSNIEYIIIDGGSKDGTLNLINEYRDYVSIFITEPDKGIYDAMNKGIDHANGEWIYFLNSDDEIFCRDTIIQVFENPNSLDYDVLYGNLVCENSLKEQFVYHSKPLKSMKYRMSFGHPACFIKSKILKAKKFSNEYRIAADYDLLLRIYLENKSKFYKVNCVVAKFSYGGISTTNLDLVYLENIRVIKSNILSSTWYYIFRFKFLHYKEKTCMQLKKMLGKRISLILIRLKYKTFKYVLGSDSIIQ